MADKKISQLTPETALSGDEIPVNRSGANFKITAGGIAALAPATTPGGSDTQVQFNDGGAFGGDAGLTFNKTTDALTAKQFTPATGTITTSLPAIDATQTWNAVGTTFTGLKFNATDTASAAGSLLMDLQVGGSNKFKVSKTGETTFSETYVIDSVYGLRRFTNAATVITAGLTGNAGIDLNGTTVVLNAIIFSRANQNLRLEYDAADTLAQRRTTNAQTFRIYNTFTDASNYERGKMEWASNVLRIGTEKAGTGSARELQLQTDGVTRLTINTSGNTTLTGALTIGASSVFSHSGRVLFSSPAIGVYTLQNNTQTDFDRLQFGGVTSSFPALKRSTTSLQARLADDSAFTNIQGKLTTETAYTAGAPTATGYLVLYDSNGTAYKVPAEAL